ncbi:hypothetical protein [Streptomyces sp. NPDC048001]|uniref:hypothetical protein n=1 Tax=Streptomyces sp. NPDC048001 TaxID=3365498 RepID=UPI003720EA9B
MLTAVATLAASVVGVTTIAFAAAPSVTSADAAAEGLPPSAVEEFTYPNAARVLAEEGILLKSGDGHILLAQCNFTGNQIRVQTVADAAVGRKELYCFEATSPTGYVALELPRVFALEAADQPISADLTAEGETTTWNLAKGQFVSVGEGDRPSGGKRSVLVEIRVTG